MKRADESERAHKSRPARLIIGKLCALTTKTTRCETLAQLDTCCGRKRPLRPAAVSGVTHTYTQGSLAQLARPSINIMEARAHSITCIALRTHTHTDARKKSEKRREKSSVCTHSHTHMHVWLDCTQITRFFHLSPSSRNSDSSNSNSRQSEASQGADDATTVNVGGTAAAAAARAKAVLRRQQQQQSSRAQSCYANLVCVTLPLL